jgi:glutathione S-transferase
MWRSGSLSNERLASSGEALVDVNESSMAGSGELKAFLTCAFLLYVKFTVAILVQSLKSFEGGTRPPEDSVLGSLSSAVLWFSRFANSGAPRDGDYTSQVANPAASAAKARDDEARWKRIVQNDLESMPLALVLFGAGVFAGGNTELFQTTIALYTIARWFHMLAYATAKQPHRAIAFWVGMAATYVGAINSLVGVFKH